MDSETLERLLRSAKITAKNIGIVQSEEDYVQEAICNLIANGPGQTVEQAVIDAVRKDRGKVDSTKHKATTATSEYIDEIHHRNSQVDRFVVAREYLPRTSSAIRGEDRAAFILFYCWELNIQEIALCFGVTESCISQRISKVEKEVSMISETYVRK